jgi:hypothetical protein
VTTYFYLDMRRSFSAVKEKKNSASILIDFLHRRCHPMLLPVVPVGRLDSDYLVAVFDSVVAVGNSYLSGSVVAAVLTSCLITLLLRRGWTRGLRSLLFLFHSSSRGSILTADIAGVQKKTCITRCQIFHLASRSYICLILLSAASCLI